MNRSGSLCPATKSAEMIGDKWTLLILRELFFGSSRFNDFQRALPRISPTILSKRLKKLEVDGLIIRKSSPADKTREYRLTKCGRELGPVVQYMATWGLRWARRRICDEDIDIGGFMWDFHRTLQTDELPDGETVMFVKLLDAQSFDTWWLIANGGAVELCTDDPGKDVDLYLTSSSSTLIEIWMGDIPVRTAIDSSDLMLTGASHLIRSAASWFPRSSMSNVRPERLMD